MGVLGEESERGEGGGVIRRDVLAFRGGRGGGEVRRLVRTRQ